MDEEKEDWSIELGREYIYFERGKKNFVLRDLGQGKYQFMLPASAEEVKARELFSKLREYLEKLSE